MPLPALLLAPSLLALLLVVGTALGARAPFVRSVSIIGVALATTTFFVRGGAERWRTVAPDDAAVALLAISTGCAWLLAVVLPHDAATAAAVGVASSALALLAGNEWLVPSLLFWLCATAALQTGTARRARAAVWPTLGLSLALGAGSVIVQFATGGSWRLNTTLGAPGWAWWGVVGAAALLAGTLGLGDVGRPPDGAALLPLRVASGFVVLDVFGGGRSEPWAAVGLVVFALASAALALLRDRAHLAPAAVVAVMLALAVAPPRPSELAAPAATLAVTALVLARRRFGYAPIAAALLVAAIPLTAARPAVTVALTTAVSKLVTTRAVAPGAFGAGLVIALAAFAVLGARIARLSGARPDLWSTVGVGTVVLVSVAASFRGTQPAEAALSVIAVAGGAVAFRRAHGGDMRPALSDAHDLASESDAAVRRWHRPLTAIGFLLTLGTTAALCWLTYEGLTAGFL